MKSNEVHELYCGHGVFKNNKDQPHPHMNRCHSATMDRKQLHSVVTACRINKQNEILKELNTQIRFGIFYDNTGKQRYKLISFLDIIYLMYFRILTFFGVK